MKVKGKAKQVKRSKPVKVKARTKTRKRQINVGHAGLKVLQKDIMKGVEKYMSQEKIGFNELVRRLKTSPTQTLKILKGEANLTMASIAHIAALLKKVPHLVFK